MAQDHRAVLGYNGSLYASARAFLAQNKQAKEHRPHVWHQHNGSSVPVAILGLPDCLGQGGSPERGQQPARCQQWPTSHLLMQSMWIMSHTHTHTALLPLQVYKDAALAEHEQLELAAAARHRAAGHSPFHNSRADEAYLMQRLEAGIPGI